MEDEITPILDELARLDYQACQQEMADRLKYQTDFMQAALKSLMLVNGGAMIALLTFLGNAKIEFDYPALQSAFSWFIGGVSSVLAAYLFAFFSQVHLMNVKAFERSNAEHKIARMKAPNDPTRSRYIGNAFVYTGAMFAFLSFLSFAMGSLEALSGIS